VGPAVVVLAHLLVITAADPSPGLSVLIAQGDEAFQEIDYPASRSAYEAALQHAPESPALLWRLARVEVCTGDMQPRASRRLYYDAAERYARAAVARDSTLAAAHTWLAAALGNIAVFEGSETKVRLSREIKEELDAALRLDPSDDVAWSILGSFYRALGRISWIERQLANIFLGGIPSGGFEDAERALKTAIGLAPNVVRHHWELGLVYAELGREEEARAEFTAVVNLPPTLGSDQRKKKRAAEWLSQAAGE
jgi:tetratricopeptide (TPR) repeat protein